VTLIDERAPSPVELRFDPAKTVAVEGALQVTVTRDARGTVLTVTVTSSGAPMDLAFRGEIRSGALQRDLGWVVFAADQPAEATFALTDVLNVWDPKTVEVRLSPSTEAAERTVEMKQIWGGLVTWYDVAVTTK
jgi:hypothetical protein